MFVILKRTLQETLKLWAVILTAAAGVLGGLLAGSSGTSFAARGSFETVLNRLLMIQHLVIFFLIYGVVLMITVSSTGAGLIAGEVHEGTFRILVAKPNSRCSILLGKVLGMLAGTFILMILGLASFFAAELSSGGSDGNIKEGLMAYIPAYLLYGLIVALFFSSAAVLLSTLAKKRIIALLPLLLMIVLILGVPLVLRLIISLRGEQSAGVLSYLDPNYHFGSMFRWCMDLCGGIHGSSTQLSLAAMLMNIFKQVPIDADLVRGTGGGTITMVNELIKAEIILGAYGAFTVINYLASFLIIRKKNV